MVQIDLPMAACTALMFVDAARQQLSPDLDPNGRYFYSTLAKVNIWTAIFFLWIPVYFVVDYFGWETTYRYNFVKMSPFMQAAFVPLVIVGVMGLANLAFWLGDRCVR